MRTENINTSGMSHMQHSEAMHKSHHGGPKEQQVSKNEEADNFQKTAAIKQQILYDAKGKVVKK